jgi:TatD DNase family protein
MELVNGGKVNAPLWSLPFHPWDTLMMPDWESSDLQECAALGEGGFDKFRGALPYPDGQLTLFRQILTLADRQGKPVVVHAVGSQEFLLKCAREFPNVRFLVHGFSKHNPPLLGELLKQGFYVSVHRGLIRDEKIRTFLQENPSCRVGLETDDAPAIAIEDLYAQMDIPGFENTADSYFRVFLQI